MKTLLTFDNYELLQSPNNKFMFFRHVEGQIEYLTQDGQFTPYPEPNMAWFQSLTQILSAVYQYVHN
jgi:hypothetical protein